MHLRLFPAKSRRLFQWPGYLALYILDLKYIHYNFKVFFVADALGLLLLKRTLKKKFCNKQEKNFFSFCWSCFVRLGRARDTNFVSGVSRQWNRMRLSYRIYQFCGTSKNIMTHKICDSSNVCIQAIWLWDIFASLYSKLVVQVTRV